MFSLYIRITETKTNCNTKIKCSIWAILTIFIKKKIKPKKLFKNIKLSKEIASVQNSYRSFQALKNEFSEGKNHFPLWSSKHNLRFCIYESTLFIISTMELQNCLDIIKKKIISTNHWNAFCYLNIKGRSKWPRR